MTQNIQESAPVLSEISNQTISEGSPIIQINAGDSGLDEDADGDAITYTCIYETTINGVKDFSAGSCSILLGSVNFDTTTGILNWTPSYSASGTYEIWITGSDGVLSDDELIVLTINDFDRPPVLDSVSDLAIAEGSPN